MYDEVRRLARLNQFFHCHLGFPGVFRPPFMDEAAENELMGWTGGFDVVLGNPPWERIKLQEQEWFAERCPEIASARNAAERRKRIDELRTKDPALHSAFLEDRRRSEGESHIIRNSNRIDDKTGQPVGLFPLCGRGDVNTYSLFTELNRNLVRRTGRASCIVPTGIATDATTQHFFRAVVENNTLVCFFGL